MDYRNYTARAAELASRPSGSTPYDNSAVEAPAPVWRAQLSSMELSLDNQEVLPISSEEGDVHPGFRQWVGSDLVPILVAEIKRLRHLVLANESLAHMESVAWWYRDTLPNTLRDYLYLSQVNG